LLANAYCQLINKSLIDRIREQARSHIWTALYPLDNVHLCQDRSWNR
jgi:hypothetical protein